MDISAEILSSYGLAGHLDTGTRGPMMAECGEVALAGVLSVGGLIVRRLAGAWQGFIGPPTRLTCSTRVLLNASCSALTHTPALRVTSLSAPLRTTSIPSC